MYNEEVFSSLDWILDQASQRGIHLILPIEVQLLTSPTHAGRERQYICAFTDHYLRAYFAGMGTI